MCQRIGSAIRIYNHESTRRYCTSLLNATKSRKIQFNPFRCFYSASFKKKLFWWPKEYKKSNKPIHRDPLNPSMQPPVHVPLLGKHASPLMQCPHLKLHASPYVPFGQTLIENMYVNLGVLRQKVILHNLYH